MSSRSLRDRPRIAAARRGAEAALRGWVREADDRKLERVLRRGPALRVLFAALARAYRPEAAEGFEGALAFELRTSDGDVRRWTIAVASGRATARPGPAADPALTLQLALPDVARFAAGELDPGRALLEGRLDLKGDFGLATRLGEMFGTRA
ncbi:MAG: sterol transfer family [Solirubrobacteraceae bacterium]|nr:sterol transfer family [Solirubrobacteraceae bacterium]